ncbi:MAG: YdcF family protein [Flintibacter sp.]|uniref:YdcF family protein n=1 Tax=Flintibacter sp. TaxID=1918624 RepID=UPI0026716384|nr:YdcF family protein [Flintibacter sp.]MCI6150315.1 YdcF family protein [Flintibacter sp.]MDD7117157.1 YdcF family protein [Flintibacter sp.]MDY5037150.1 YdcF family protein [Lawsonibacter sp.]
MAGYRGKQPRRWLSVLLTLVLIGTFFFAIMFGLVMVGAHDVIRGNPQVMIVLGCRVMPGGEPSILLQDRLDTALDYLDDHPDMTVVVSGGQGSNEPTSEAACMADYLEEHGVDSHQILLEDQSSNTKENLIYSRELLEEHGIVVLRDEVLVVSNGFHLTRAQMLAERYGYKSVSALAAPTSHIPSRIQMYIREPLALVKSFFLDK